MKEIGHFEQIALLREGLGADRISDMTAGLLRRRLATYTSSICNAHDVPVVTRTYRRGYFDEVLDRWMPFVASLPLNPSSGHAVLLVPERYLRDLPTISPDEFWDFCWFNENEMLRHELSQDIARRVDKRTIIELARKHPDTREAFISAVEEKGARPYDLGLDKHGYTTWYRATQEYCARHPLHAQPESQESFQNFMNTILDQFRLFIEERGGNVILWNDNGRPRKELIAQRLFLGMVAGYCRINDIDVSPEANIGRGPVDFKFSHGYRLRCATEIKLARNRRLWHGLETQLPTYMKAEEITLGYFLVVAHAEEELEKLHDLANRAHTISEAAGTQIMTFVVFAPRRKPSASTA